MDFSAVFAGAGGVTVVKVGAMSSAAVVVGTLVRGSGRGGITAVDAILVSIAVAGAIAIVIGIL